MKSLLCDCGGLCPRLRPCFAPIQFHTWSGLLPSWFIDYAVTSPRASFRNGQDRIEKRTMRRSSLRIFPPPIPPHFPTFNLKLSTCNASSALPQNHHSSFLIGYRSLVFGNRFRIQILSFVFFNSTHQFPTHFPTFNLKLLTRLRRSSKFIIHQSRFSSNYKITK